VDIFDVDKVDPEIVIVAVEGRYGILDWQGFHPSPRPSFEEEVRRDPVSAMNNRLARAKKLQSQGCIKMAKKLRKEAEGISQIIYIKSQTPRLKVSKVKLKFSS